jgi:hypothetical protein
VAAKRFLGCGRRVSATGTVARGTGSSAVAAAAAGSGTACVESRGCKALVDISEQPRASISLRARTRARDLCAGLRIEFTIE